MIQTQEVYTMFSDKLIAIRKSKGLSQQKLANLTGLSRSTIGMYEIGKNEPNFTQLNKLADALGVSISELIDDKKNELLIISEMQKREEREELSQYLDLLRTRPEMRVLLDTVAGATKEEVEANVQFLEALRKK